MDLLEKRDGPAADLTDNLIVEILSRLPFKSVCRFKCVSRHWLHDLITSPNHRAKLPQTLTGFFRPILNHGPSDRDDDDDDVDSCGLITDRGYDNHDTSDVDDYGDEDEEEDADDFSYTGTSVPDFVSVVGEEGHQVVCPSLSFLPGDIYTSIFPKHCSNGFVLCLCSKVFPFDASTDYVVCNPATEEWVTLPGYSHRDRSFMPLHLAVDPTSASGHFHLFALLQSDYGYIAGVDIYSSEARAWSHHESGWPYGTKVHDPADHLSVFLHGMLHLVSRGGAIVVVDTEGSTWKTIPLLEAMEPIYLNSCNVPFIGESRGRLHYVNSRSRDYYALAVWTLEAGDEWIYKYNISTPRFFAANLMDGFSYSLVAIHPERNIIFFTSRRDNTLRSYDFDRGEFRVLGTLHSFSGGRPSQPYLPYVPSSRSIAA